jgi:hypothetical protein
MCQPVIARSLKRASELGDSSHSFRLAFGYSLPMIGVTSKDSKLSRAPASFSGTGYSGTAGLSSTGSAFKRMVSVTEAMTETLGRGTQRG